MDTIPSFFSFMALVLLLLLSQAATVNGGDDTLMRKDNVKGIIGAIVDYSSRSGKEEKVAMEMAIEDFYLYKNQSFLLHIKNSQREPFRAALAATSLIKKHKVQAILGPRTWEEASIVNEMSNKAQIPILSFADTTPKWATERWPFLVQASPNQAAQMKAIAAIVQSWEWHRVTLIYEDINSVATGIIPHLSDALREVNVEISQLVPLPPFASSSLSKQLQGLKTGQCRVFIIHLSFPLALRLFEKANKMDMMEEDYVWITTDIITSLFHSINASTISSMKGIIGVESYFPETGHHFRDFYHRFRKRFSSKHPEEDNHEPGIFAVQAYDAIWTVALAMGERKMLGTKQLLKKILLTKFDGLSTKIEFMDRQLAPAIVFQIVNVMGKSYTELGFWSEKLGFSKTINERANTYNSSMKYLGQVFFPGGPWNIPRGWSLPTSADPLRIGVPAKTIFKQYMEVVQNYTENNVSVSGFSIDVFKAILERLPYYLPYKFIPFEGTYDALVEQVHLKNFDAVVADVSIVARRYQHAEFTLPYTETGLVMIVPVRSKTYNKALLFLKPFTKAMWLLIGVINVYNGFVVWLIERNHSSELKGSVLNQIGTLLWLAVSTLFSPQGGKLHSNLSKVAMMVWMFVTLIITQTYMANLTSMLTVQQLEPTVADVESLLKSNAMVGYCRRSFVARYLEEVLHFNPKNIKHLGSPEEFARALRSKQVDAAFIETPLAKLFLARYCKGFTTAGPTYKVGGFGFVFPRGSPLVPDVSEALLKVSESGKLRELENNMIGSEKCVDMEADDENSSLSPNNFWVLFTITGGTSSISLVIYIFGHLWNLEDSLFEHKTIWRMMLAIIKQWGYQKRQFSRRVSEAERPRNSPNHTLDLWASFRRDNTEN